jgi:hypothetical protein
MNQKILGLVVALVIVTSVLGYALAQSIIQSNVIHVSIPYKLSLTYGIYTSGQIYLQAHLSLNNAPVKNALIEFYLCDSNGSNQIAIGGYHTNSYGCAQMNYYTTDCDLYFKATWIVGS